MPIRAKLMILFIGIVVISIFFVGSITHVNTRNALKETSLAGLEVISGFMKEEIVNHLDEMKTRALDFSSDGYIRDSLEIIAGQEASEKNEDLNLHLLRNKKPLDENIVRIDILNLEGVVVASTDPRGIGEDRSKERHFIDGKEEICVTGLHKTDIDGRTVLEVLAPIKDRVDPTKIIGVIVNYYDAILLNSLFAGGRALTLGETDETYLVNREKMMVTSSLFTKNAAFKQKVDTYPVRKYLQDNEEVSGIWRDYRGISVIGSSRILDRGDFCGVLISEQDMAEAFIPVYNLRKFLIIFGVIVSLLVALVSLVISQSISKPIHALRKGTEIIEKGNLGYKVGTSEKDEIGRLSRSFDSMVGAIKKRNEELEILNKKKTDFIDMVAHELKTPVTIIAELADFLTTEKWDKQEKKRFAKSLREKVKRLTAIMSEIELASQQNQKGTPSKIEDIKLEDLIQGLKNELSQFLELRNQKLITTIEVKDIVIKGDSLKISDALFNIIQNASKFSEDGKEICIRTRKSDKQAIIEIEDHGIGIAKDKLNVIFNPFYEETDVTQHHSGTFEFRSSRLGMGLYISKGIIEKQGGSITVESELGKGSKFFVLLPLKSRDI